MLQTERASKSGVIAAILKQMQGLLRKPRTSPRTARNATVCLFSETAYIGQANLLDESEGGAKLSCPTPDALKRTRYLLNPNTAMVNSVALAWTSGREAGFQYLDGRKLRGYIDDPKLEHIQAFWTSRAGAPGAGAPRGVFGRAR